VFALAFASTPPLRDEQRRSGASGGELAREDARCPARTGDLLLVRREQLLPSTAASRSVRSASDVPHLAAALCCRSSRPRGSTRALQRWGVRRRFTRIDTRGSSVVSCARMRTRDFDLRSLGGRRPQEAVGNFVVTALEHRRRQQPDASSAGQPLQPPARRCEDRALNPLRGSIRRITRRPRCSVAPARAPVEPARITPPSPGHPLSALVPCVENLD
jgi:hypothetical protein